MPVGDNQKDGLLSKFKLPSLLGRKKDDSQKPLLSSSQRSCLLDFERHVVLVRLEDDAQSVQVGTQIFNAIIGDYAFFNGLKPLPQYPDDFSYELLFPSWLNLNTVMIQPTEGSNTRFSDAQQRVTFSFLLDWCSASQHDESDLLALMTIIANRISHPHGHDIMQRLIDLSFDRDGHVDTEDVDRLISWQSDSESGETFAKWIADYLFVYSCLRPTSQQKKYDVANTKLLREELPRVLRDFLLEHQDDEDQREPYRDLLDLVHTLVETTGGFEADLEQLLNNHSSQLVELLRLFVVDDGESRARPQPLQRLMAELATRQSQTDGQIDTKSLQPFAQHVAPRLDHLSRSTTIFFEAEFVRKEPNRKALLGGCRTPDTRQKLTDQLIKLAGSAKQVDRFLHLIAIAAALNPTIDDEDITGIHASIAVLQMNLTEQSIGRNELSDLVGDIRSNLPESIRTLARPLEAALNKSDRLARLYLTLNEEVQILQHSGNISNFGVTRASFSHLEKLADEDE